MNAKIIVIGVVSVLVVICFAVILGGLGIQGLTDDVMKTKNVHAAISISGQDIVVTVLGGSDIHLLEEIWVYLEDRQEMRHQFRSVHTGDVLTCTDMAKGVEGTHFVIVEAAFLDGGRGYLEYKRIEFS